MKITFPVGGSRAGDAQTGGVTAVRAASEQRRALLGDLQSKLWHRCVAPQCAAVQPGPGKSCHGESPGREEGGGAGGGAGGGGGGGFVASARTAIKQGSVLYKVQVFSRYFSLNMTPLLILLSGRKRQDSRRRGAARCGSTATCCVLVFKRLLYSCLGVILANGSAVPNFGAVCSAGRSGTREGWRRGGGWSSAANVSSLTSLTSPCLGVSYFGEAAQEAAEDIHRQEARLGLLQVHIFLLLMLKGVLLSSPSTGRSCAGGSQGPRAGGGGLHVQPEQQWSGTLQHGSQRAFV